MIKYLVCKKCEEPARYHRIKLENGFIRCRCCGYVDKRLDFKEISFEEFKKRRSENGLD